MNSENAAAGHAKPSASKAVGELGGTLVEDHRSADHDRVATERDRLLGRDLDQVVDPFCSTERPYSSKAPG